MWPISLPLKSRKIGGQGPKLYRNVCFILPLKGRLCDLLINGNYWMSSKYEQQEGFSYQPKKLDVRRGKDCFCCFFSPQLIR